MSSSKTFKPFGLFYSLITRFKRHKESAQQQTVDLLSICVGTRDRSRQPMDESDRQVASIGVETIFEEMGLNYATELGEEIRDLITTPDEEEDGVDDCSGSESLVEDEEEKEQEIIMEEDHQMQEADPEAAEPPSDLRENADTASITTENDGSMLRMFIKDNAVHDHQYGQQQSRDGNEMMEQDNVDTDGNLGDDEDSLTKSPAPLCIDLSAFDLDDILSDGREALQLTSSQVDHISDDAIVRELLRQSGALSPFDFLGFPSSSSSAEGSGGQGSQSQTGSHRVGPTERQLTPQVSLLVEYELTDNEDDEEEDLMDTTTTTSSGSTSQTPESSSYEGEDEESDLENGTEQRSSSLPVASQQPMPSDEEFFCMAQAYLDKKVADDVIEEEEDVSQKDNDEYLRKQKDNETLLEDSVNEKDEQPSSEICSDEESLLMTEANLDKKVPEKVKEEEVLEKEILNSDEYLQKQKDEKDETMFEDSEKKEEDEQSVVPLFDEESLMMAEANLDKKIAEKVKEEEEHCHVKVVPTKDVADKVGSQQKDEEEAMLVDSEQQIPKEVLRSDEEYLMKAEDHLDSKVPEKVKDEEQEEEVSEKDILKNSKGKRLLEKKVIMIEDSDFEDFPPANSIQSKKMKYTKYEDEVPIFSTAPLTEQSIEGSSGTPLHSPLSSLAVQRNSPRVNRRIISPAAPSALISPFRARSSAQSPTKKQVTPPADFVCTTCSKRFKTRTSWRNHNLTHLGVKPFRCTWQGCDFAATVRSYVLRHIRTKHLQAAAIKIEEGQEPASINPKDYVAVDENFVENPQ